MLDWWLSRLAPATAVTYGYILRRFMKWLRENGGEFSEMSPDDLVNYQREAVYDDKFKILDLIQKYVSSRKARVSTKRAIYSTLRSFFLHNRAELPRDTSFIIRSGTPPVEGTLSVEDIRDIVLISNPAYRAAFLSIFQGGMDLSSFLYWNLNGWDSLKEDLKNDPDVIKIWLPGRKKFKNIKPFYTFIGPDTIKAIRTYLPYRDKAREIFDKVERKRRQKAQEKESTYKEIEFKTAIFYNQFGRPIGRYIREYWFHQTLRLGLVKQKRNSRLDNRYGKNIHETRDVFRSQCEKSPAKGSVAEFVMGHQVDPLEYNKAFRDERWTMKEYKKALPMLQIMSSGRPFGLVEEEEVDAIREKQWADRAVRDEVLIKRVKEEITREIKEKIMREFGLDLP